MDKVNLKGCEKYSILWLNLTLDLFLPFSSLMLHLSICNLYYSCNLVFIELMNKLTLNFQMISVKQV